MLLLSYADFACWVIFHALVVVCSGFSKLTFSKNSFQEHFQSVKPFGSRPWQMFCRSWSGSKLFAKVISRRQKSIFFKISFFKKFFSGKLPECQRVWIQTRTDVLSVLIWVQTVCKGYQQTTKNQRISKSAFWKNLSGIPSECQTVSIQIRTDILSVLIWFQTVCKGYQQKTKNRPQHGKS